MSKPTIALIIPLGDSPFPVDPGFGVGAPIFHPGHPDHGLPSAGRPVDPGYGRPIYHPGHPDHGLPSGGRPVDPGFGNRPWNPVDPGFGQGGTGQVDNSLPSIPGLPSNGLPHVPGDPVTLPTPLPTPPADLSSDLVVAVWNPNKKAWTVTSWDLDASAGHPLPPTASPKSA